jgi:hypothetical protein
MASSSSPNEWLHVHIAGEPAGASRCRQRTWFDSAGAALDPGLRSQNLDETKHVRFRLAVSVN